jgi:serine/threonine-protein kinase
MRSEAIKPGDVIAGKYRVRAILSRSRGFLVDAFHTEFDQRVAIRILSPHLVDEKEVERFRRETRTLAKLESEHVARILDVGTTKDGAFYFARQYLEGTDLERHLKQRGPLPLADAVLMILQVAEAVTETHVHNIILRELQPSHLFLTERLGGSPQIKVIDFGTAKLMKDAAAPTAGGELTSTAMFGLSCYSSPELVRKAQHVDVRTDVWSLGAIFYQLLTGRRPFEGEMAALMLAISRDDPVPVTRYRPDLPADIDKIINWALAKDPDGRFANVHGFAHSLTPFASAEGQVLIQRIGAVTTAGKRKRKEAAAVDRDHPVTIDGNDLLEEEPEPPVDNRAAAYQGAIPAGRPAQEDDAPPLERTMFMGAGYVAPSPAAGGGVQRPGLPAPPPPRAAQPGAPMFGGAATGMPRPGSVPPPAQQSLLGPSPNFGPAPAQSAPPWQQQPQPQPQPQPQVQNGGQRLNGIPPGAMATVVSQSSMGTGGYPAVSGGKAPPKGAKVALAAMAGVVVLLSVVAAVVVIKGGSGGAPPAGSEAVAGTAAPSGNAAAASSTAAAPAGTAAAPAPANTGSAPAPAAEPVAVASSAPAPAPALTGRLPTASSGSASKGKPSAAPSAAPPPAAGGSDNGTLVAVAVGGSCAFSVNGASKGTMSTLKLSVKPGTYSVTCAPSTGGTKSKSVTVSSGGTAMAMFKL